MDPRDPPRSRPVLSLSGLLPAYASGMSTWLGKPCSDGDHAIRVAVAVQVVFWVIVLVLAT